MDIFVRNVDEGIFKQFKTYIIRKYGKLHGFMGIELSLALKEYMEKRGVLNLEESPEKQEKKKTFCNHDINSFPPSPEISGTLQVKSSASFRKLIHLVKMIVDESPSELPEQVIERMIASVCGTSDKTIEKYKSLLQLFSVITPLRVQVHTQKYIYGVDLNVAKKLAGLHV